MNRVPRTEATVQTQPQWESIVESVSQAVVVTDEAFHVRYCNAAAEQAIGVERAAAVGAALEDLLPGRYDGGAPYVAGWRFERAATGWTAYGECSGAAANRRAAAEQYIAIEQLSGGLAQEIGPPLTAISVATEYLLKGVERGSAEARDLGMVLAQAERIGRLARQLVDLGRPAEPVLDAVDFDEVVADGFRLVERQLQRNGVQSTLELAAGGSLVAADGNQLQQVVIDLVQHCQRATLLPEAGEKWVEVRTRTRGGLAELSVTDRGPALGEEEIARLFLPLLSRGDAPEYGLYKARWIVHRHGGWLDAQSRAGRGTTFTAHFPMRNDGGTS